MIVLIANIGSTSFKYRLFDTNAWTVKGYGGIERIGRPGSDCPDYETAISRCVREISGAGKPLGGLNELAAIGFKAVHAGPVSGAVRVDDRVLAAMEEFAFLAPAHNPPYIAAMRSFQKALPAVPLVALFETAFFGHLDDAASTYAVPHGWKEEFGIRRYGFHGASHRAASESAQDALGRNDLRHISCHLGGEFQPGGDPVRSGCGYEFRHLAAIRNPAEQPHGRSGCFCRAIHDEEAERRGG